MECRGNSYVVRKRNQEANKKNDIKKGGLDVGSS